MLREKRGSRRDQKAAEVLRERERERESIRELENGRGRDGDQGRR